MGYSPRGHKESDATERLHFHCECRASQVALVGKNSPAHAGDIRDTDLISGSKDPLEEVMATHSRILAWRIPRTEEPGGLQPVGSQRVGHSDQAQHMGQDMTWPG